MFFNFDLQLFGGGGGGGGGGVTTTVNFNISFRHRTSPSAEPTEWEFIKTVTQSGTVGATSTLEIELIPNMVTSLIYEFLVETDAASSVASTLINFATYTGASPVILSGTASFIAMEADGNNYYTISE